MVKRLSSAWLLSILLCAAAWAVEPPLALSPEVKAELDAAVTGAAMADASVTVLVQAVGAYDAGAAGLNFLHYQPRERPVLYSHNPELPLIPASNMKILTGAAILDRLGGEYQFFTTVRAAPAVDGTVENLWLVGGGDPALDLAQLRQLAESVRAAGVTRVSGSVICDAHRYRDKFPEGWTEDDTLWYYGAEVWGIALARNQIDVTVRPGDAVGEPAEVSFSPESSFVRPINRLTTGAEGITASIEWSRDPATGQTVVSGRVPLRVGASWSQGMAVANVPLYCATVFTDFLRDAGVTVEGGPDVGHWPVGADEIARFESEPLRVSLRGMMKRSDNLWAEMYNRELGYQLNRDGSAASGAQAVREFLAKFGIDDSLLTINDGSGLSRRDQLTAQAIMGVLLAMADHPMRDIFYDSLPVAGVDGTLASRMKGTKAEGNVHAKTGSLTGRSSLSGYVVNASGDLLAVSTMFNDFKVSAGEARGVSNRIFEALANWQR
ncbi:MAG TPA: D-alanyl-D-alanine carboxypeptidase/D-alanyl-D-alanine-endopeptidase [Armatimonadetes bacterium]|nr:D-alanyl-D-alanine carboxypeptidase/D-alanyl-D-alanine-endopeptidase [Armatimonadota bacterium]